MAPVALELLSFPGRAGGRTQVHGGALCCCAGDINSGHALLAQVKCKTGGRQQVKREPQAGCDNARPAGSRQTLLPLGRY